MLTQQTSLAFSGNIPKNYDAYLGPMFFEPYALEMAKRISRLAPKNMLELAAGTGRLTRLLPAAAADGAKIIASDINPSMVKFGMQRTRHDHITWREIDAVSLPFAENTFDCIAVQFGVMFYSDRAKAFAEALRVLKPGGTFIFTAWDKISNNRMPSLTNQALEHFFPIDTPAFYKVPFSYYDESVIHNDLANTGFHSISIDNVIKTGYVKSAANAAKGLVEGVPVVTAIEDRDPGKLPVILNYLEEQIKAQYGSGELKVNLSALVVSAKK